MNKVLLLGSILAWGYYLLIPGGYDIMQLSGEAGEIVERVTEPIAQRTTQDLIDDVTRKYGLPKLVVDAVISKESGGDINAIRFEDHNERQLSIAYKYTKNKSEARVIAASHCFFQVMGYNAEMRGVKWHELYQPEICAEMGAVVLAGCLERYKDKDSFTWVREGLKCYNGSYEYADAAIRKNILPKLFDQLRN